MKYSLKEIKIILASQSKVRKEILDKNNINCVVEKSNVDEDSVKLVYRTTYSGKLHYWDYTNNYPGHVREDSDIRPITKDQEAVLAKILEDFINSERE